MLIITKDSVKSLKERLRNPNEASQCREELKKMLEIEEALLWRADAGFCCTAGCIATTLARDVQLLEAALQAFEEGNANKAAALLEEFASSQVECA
jgi:hypothetical protein